MLNTGFNNISWWVLGCCRAFSISTSWAVAVVAVAGSWSGCARVVVGRRGRPGDGYDSSNNSSDSVGVRARNTDKPASGTWWVTSRVGRHAPTRAPPQRDGIQPDDEAVFIAKFYMHQFRNQRIKISFDEVIVLDNHETYETNDIQSWLSTISWYLTI